MSRFNRQFPAFSLVALPLLWWAERQYGRMPILPRPAIPPRLPSLSIIVPARNEADNICRVLDSLSRLEYPGELEIVVVDDDSSDETAVLANRFDVQIVTLNALPPGWLGKPHACYQGAQAAQGEWLLFTDADTIHRPDSAARAVTFALQSGLGGLSLFLAYEVNGPVDRIMLMMAHAGLFAGLTRLDGLMNGQYVLLRREVYAESGGHAAVRRETMEDLALGHHLYRLGYRTPALLGEDAAMVHMYRDLSHLGEGMSRLSASSLRWSGVGAGLTAVLMAAAATPLTALLQAVAGRRSPWPHLGYWGVISAAMLPWSRRFGQMWLALLSPLAALALSLVGLIGLLRLLFQRGLRWKDRIV